MSTPAPATVKCPACGAAVDFDCELIDSTIGGGTTILRTKTTSWTALREHVAAEHVGKAAA